MTLLNHWFNADYSIISTISMPLYSAVDAATITIPSNVQNGDLGIFWDSIVAGSALTSAKTISPAGWTSMINNYIVNNSDGGSNGQQQLFYRIMSSSDSGTTITGTNVSTTTGVRRKMICIFRFNKAISSCVFENYQYSQTLSDPSSITINKTYQTAISFGLYRSGDSNLNSPYVSQTTTGTYTPVGSFRLDYTFYKNHSLSHTLDLGSGISYPYSYLGGFTLRLN